MGEYCIDTCVLKVWALFDFIYDQRLQIYNQFIRAKDFFSFHELKVELET
jgi:hypothetical protein